MRYTPAIAQHLNAKPDTHNNRLHSAFGAALTVFCGLALLLTNLGDAWVSASYDYLFRFDHRAITNQVVVLLMDNESRDHFHQSPDQPWDRAFHARLLRRLTDDGCALVVFDVFFRAARDSLTDEQLADALRRQKKVVLMAEQAAVAHPMLAGAHPALPADFFLSAAGTNWGVAWLDPDLDGVVRRHWPFPCPGTYPSLPWTVARTAGASLPVEPREYWLRFYAPRGPWVNLSYRFALTQPPGYFRDKIVFIGSEPKTSVPNDEPDEFRTPYTRWTGESMGGVQIMVTSFLNLMNGDALRRPGVALEIFLVLAAGLLFGGTLSRLRPWAATGVSLLSALVVALAAVSASHSTNYWLPWLVIAGGQLPCACAWAVISRTFLGRERGASDEEGKEAPPEVSGYDLIQPPIGQGSYGKVWLARDTAGQWHALKIVYLAKFDGNTDPYNREFNGIKRYMPFSDKHPGLLRVSFVSEPDPTGFFYYVMELGDSLSAGWREKPSAYQPRDLVSERIQWPGKKLPARHCVQIGLELADTLHFLHRQGLTHRDIKPQNVIFVNGRPKLADLGLVAEIRPSDQTRTYVGTPGYMPPPPELPGTVQADIYALGVMLYVLSTGRTPSFFPEIATTLADGTSLPDFLRLNSVILKACDPDCAQRYASAQDMHHDLLRVQRELETAAASPAAGPPGHGQPQG